MTEREITANDILICDSVVAVLHRAYDLLADVIRVEPGAKPWIERTPALTIEPTWSTYQPDLSAGRIPGAVRLNAWLDPDQTWQFIPPPDDPHLTDPRGVVHARWTEEVIGPEWGLRLRQFGHTARYKWRGDSPAIAVLISAELRYTPVNQISRSTPLHRKAA